MRVDIVTPERQLASTEATSVQIPAMEGDMTVMENHAPVVTTLRPGVVSVGGEASYVVTGGFAEISTDGLSILAEQAMPQEEASGDVLSGVLSDAEKAAEIANGDVEAAAAQQRVNDIQDLIRRLG
ncbi:MAG: ATP synthase F1 subunit epsilon [Pseudomonadota bacterium]